MKLTATELAAREKVSFRTVYNWTRKGVRGAVLGHTCVGRRIVIDDADFEAWKRVVTARRPGMPALARLEA